MSPTRAGRPAGPFAPTGPTTSALVTKIVDGDTIHVSIGGRDVTIRYIGMDTPEDLKPGSPVEPLSREAAAVNEQLVGGKKVILERDVSEVDRFGRTLRNVWLTSASGYVLVDFELVLRGLARVTTFPPDVKYEQQLLAAQRWAQASRIGLWALPVASPSNKPVGLVTTCDAAYPDRCIPPPPPDLDCADIGHRIRVLPPDPHHFDVDGNGIGCEAYPP